MRTANIHNPMHLRRRGFAMLLVLVLLAMVAVVGVSYVSSASIRTAAVDNCVRAARARYIAESGLTHGLYMMKHDAEGLVNAEEDDPLGPFFVDATNDSYVLYADQATDGSGESIPGRYIIRARATTGETQQTASATVQRDNGGEIAFRSGCAVTGDGAWLPSALRVNGPVVVNGGMLINSARIRGDCSATDGIISWGGQITGDAEPRASTVDMPAVDWRDYRVYTYAGGIHNARRLETSTFDSAREENEGGVVGPGNPGGVLQIESDSGVVRLTRGVEFEGTLLVDGDLVLDGRDIELTARPGFPAIVCTGRVWLTGRSKVEVDGLVVSKHGIWSYFTDNSTRLKINGGLSTVDTGVYPFIQGRIHIDYEEDRCTLLDVSGSADAVSLEVLRWDN